MMPPVGKSGPGMCAMSAAAAAPRSIVASAGSSMKATTASTTSRRLCGGMFVAMPTAIPEEPLTSRFGKRAGSTTGSCLRPS